MVLRAPCVGGAAHPRSRGEHRSHRPRGRHSRGSSPLTRGARFQPAHMPREVRLIPAHAGSTGVENGGFEIREAHPRSRGEHPDQQVSEAKHRGSSPLTRGALALVHRLGHHLGLIPAHAGSTPYSCAHAIACSAHPRSRGEHIHALFGESMMIGSSPLTRGARGLGVRFGGRRRLIPAHAGSTGSAFLPLSEDEAHPRSRGEHVGCSDWVDC